FGCAAAYCSRTAFGLSPSLSLAECLGLRPSRRSGRVTDVAAASVAGPRGSELLPQCALANANRLLVQQTDFTEEPSQHRYIFVHGVRVRRLELLEVARNILAPCLIRHRSLERVRKRDLPSPLSRFHALFIYAGPFCLLVFGDLLERSVRDLHRRAPRARLFRHETQLARIVQPLVGTTKVHILTIDEEGGDPGQSRRLRAIEAVPPGNGRRGLDLVAVRPTLLVRRNEEAQSKVGEHGLTAGQPQLQELAHTIVDR